MSWKLAAGVALVLLVVVAIARLVQDVETGTETWDASRAAGFAMASDEGLQESKVEVKLEAEAWRSGEAVQLLQGPQTAAQKASTTDWLKGLFGLSGRRAPA